MKMDACRTIGAFLASVFLLGACSATSEDPKDLPNGGTGGSSANNGGKAANGGSTPSFGGSSSGGSFSNGGSTSKGGSTSTGGATSGGSTTGGTTSVGGTTGVGGTTTAGTGGAPTGKAEPMIYDGKAGAPCTNVIKSPRVGYWFTYNDMTGMQTPAATEMAMFGELNGKGGATDCAVHTKGSGFTKWGAGVGFDLNNIATVSSAYDASAYTGIRFAVKGTATNTRGLAYAAAPNTLQVKVVTTANTGGDDFAGFCTMTADWTVCQLPFATLARDGWEKAIMPPPTFSAAQITKIQFQASMHDPQAPAPAPPVFNQPVAFDFWIDDVEFY
ncbi:MAG TPA: hypothetical protein VER33_08910 [Polyangiaceae bacterium]|nr:hypothetical protein [Polyangiaceae bacterium]